MDRESRGTTHHWPVPLPAVACFLPCLWSTAAAATEVLRQEAGLAPYEARVPGQGEGSPGFRVPGQCGFLAFVVAGHVNSTVELR